MTMCHFGLNHIVKKLHKHCTFDGDHGRIERRKMVASSNIEWLQQRHDWPGLKSIIAMTSTREVKDEKQLSGYKQSVETRYFISSMPADNVEKIATAVRVREKNDTSMKVGIKIKRLKAGWDPRYLRKIIKGI